MEAYLVLLVIAGVGFIVFLYLFVFHTDKSDEASPYEQVKAISSKSSRNMNRFKARKEEKAATARTKLNQARVSEMSTLTSMISTETNATVAVHEAAHVNDRLDDKRELERVTHQADLASEENRRVAAQNATAMGIELNTFNHILTRMIDVFVQTTLLQQGSQIKMDEAKQLKDLEMKVKRMGAELAQTMAKFKTLMPVHEYNELHNQYSGVLKEIDLVKELPNGTLKKAEAKRLVEKKKTFQEMLYDRRRRLVQEADDEDV